MHWIEWATVCEIKFWAVRIYDILTQKLGRGGRGVWVGREREVRDNENKWIREKKWTVCDE